MNDPEYVEALEGIQVNLLQVDNEQKKSQKRVAGKRKRDETFKFTGRIPLERRCSNRIKNNPPDYTYADLPDEVSRC